MRNYTTQMDAARKGILTPEIETVAKKEHMPVEKLMQLVAEGKVAICANKKHTCLDPEGVGLSLIHIYPAVQPSEVHQKEADMQFLHIQNDPHPGIHEPDP